MLSLQLAVNVENRSQPAPLVLQAMETMLYTIDHINGAREAILPAGVSVGAHVLDDCDTDTYGLEQAVDFIKGRTRTQSL